MAEEIKKGKAENAADLANSDKYPGVSINKADKDRVNPKLVKQWTKEINNNPRNNDL